MAVKFLNKKFQLKTIFVGAAGLVAIGGSVNVISEFVAFDYFIKSEFPSRFFSLDNVLHFRVMFMVQPTSWGNFVILSVTIFSFGAAIIYTLSLAFTSELIIKLKVRGPG